MSNNLYEKIKENISCSVVLFPDISDGMVPFEIITELDSKRGKISFSGVIMIGLKKCLNEKLELMLLKDDGDKEKISTYHLSDITLDINELPQKGYESFSYKRIEGDDYEHRIGIRFNYKDIPIKGAGEYAIFLVFKENEIINPLNGFYFNVV